MAGGPGITASYTYNGLDTRVGKTENGNTQVYKRDGVYVTDDVLSDSSAFYTPGVSEKRAGVTSYLHGGLKNQTRQTNSSQTTTATRTYDAFGNVTSSSGTWNGPFGFGYRQLDCPKARFFAPGNTGTGNAGAFGYQEDATGLKLLGHRYYDSSIGRFLTRDPIKDGRNWYAYCGNNPVNGADPSGLLEPVTTYIVIACGAIILGLFLKGCAETAADIDEALQQVKIQRKLKAMAEEGGLGDSDTFQQNSWSERGNGAVDAASNGFNAGASTVAESWNLSFGFVRGGLGFSNPFEFPETVSSAVWGAGKDLGKDKLEGDAEEDKNQKWIGPRKRW